MVPKQPTKDTKRQRNNEDQQEKLSKRDSLKATISRIGEVQDIIRGNIMLKFIHFFHLKNNCGGVF